MTLTYWTGAEYQVTPDDIRFASRVGLRTTIRAGKLSLGRRYTKKAPLSRGQSKFEIDSN